VIVGFQLSATLLATNNHRRNVSHTHVLLLLSSIIWYQ